MSEAKKLKITLKKSVIGRCENHKRIVRALGLKKVNQTVEQFDTPTIRGMVTKVEHLLAVE